MRNLVRLVLVVAALALALGAPSLAAAEPAAPAPAPTLSLYQRIGGYNTLAAVTDDFLARLTTDRDLSVFFAGHAQNSIKRIRQDLVDFLCQATGGPCEYTGRDMKTAHQGLGITQAQWDHGVALLDQALDQCRVTGQEKADVLALVQTLTHAIVEKP